MRLMFMKRNKTGQKRKGKLFYEKACAEQKHFIEELKIMPPEVIIQSAYEDVTNENAQHT